MTVSVLLEGTLRDGERDRFTNLLTEKFKLTKTFDGFQTIDLTYNVEDPNNWVITELWDSKEDSKNIYSSGKKMAPWMKSLLFARMHPQ